MPQLKRKYAADDAEGNGDPADGPLITPSGDPKTALEVALSARNRGVITERRHAVWVVATLYEYMRNHADIDQKLIAPAWELAVGLDDLDRGIGHPIFAPRSMLGRPRASTKDECLREITAVAATILMDGGSTEGEANRVVMRKLASVGCAVSHATVGNWRSIVVAELPRGVGLPRKPDDRSALSAFEHLRHSKDKRDRERYSKVGLFLHRWTQWRAYNTPHLARCFVDSVLVSDMRDFVEME